MNRTTAVFAIGLALAAALATAPATAQNARSFVSPTGLDTNNCQLATPCRTFAAAILLTNAGGEIAVLGTAGYGSVTITKAISIVNGGGFEAAIAVPSTGTGITINAGASDAVSLRGLTIEGGGVGNTGIQFNTGKSLTIEDCVIRHVVGDAVDFFPNAAASIFVSNTRVTDNANHGIYVAPPIGAGVIGAVFNRVQANNNGNSGIAVYGGTSTGSIKADVYDSVAAGNTNIGFAAVTFGGGAPTTLTVSRSISANNLDGLYAEGTGALIRVANSMVIGNANGWLTASSGVLQSAGDNTIEGNAGSETPPGTYATK